MMPNGPIGTNGWRNRDQAALGQSFADAVETRPEEIVQRLLADGAPTRGMRALISDPVVA